MVATRSSSSGSPNSRKRAQPEADHSSKRKRRSPPARKSPTKKKKAKATEHSTAKLPSCVLCLDVLPPPSSDEYSLGSELRFFRDVKDLCSSHDILDQAECDEHKALCLRCFALARACDEEYGLFLEKVQVCRIVRQRAMGRCRVVLEPPSKLKMLLEVAKELKQEADVYQDPDVQSSLDVSADVPTDFAPEFLTEEVIYDDEHDAVDSFLPFEENMAGELDNESRTKDRSLGGTAGEPSQELGGSNDDFLVDMKVDCMVPDASIDILQVSMESAAIPNGTEVAADAVRFAERLDNAAVSSNQPTPTPTPTNGPKPATLKVLRWCSTGANAGNAATYTEYFLDGVKRGYVVEGFFFTRNRASQFEKDVVLIRCSHKRRGTCPVWGAINLTERKFYYPTLISAASHNHTDSGFQFAKDVSAKIKNKMQKKKKRKSRAKKKPVPEARDSDDEYGLVEDEGLGKSWRKRDHLICAECSVQKVNATALYRHYQAAHSIPGGFMCQECGRSFVGEDECKEHEAGHLQKYFDKMSCITCRQVVKRDSLVHHVVQRHGGKTARTMDQRREMGLEIMRCSLDSYWTTFIKNFQLHAVQCHPGPEEKPFLCNDCGESFKARLYLRAHRAKEHTNLPAYNCRTCGAGFLDRYAAEKHVAEHRVEKGVPSRNYLCPHCGAVFEARASWKSHMSKFHDALEQHGFQCPDCPGKFETYLLLRRHKAEMHGAPPVPTCLPRKVTMCPVCGVKTRSKCEYIGHMRLRHGISLPGGKEYPCFLCGRVLFSGKQLRDHEKKLHGFHYAAYKQTGLLCSLCDFACPDRDEFKNHLLAAHQQKVTVKKLWTFMRKPDTAEKDVEVADAAEFVG